MRILCSTSQILYVIRRKRSSLPFSFRVNFGMPLLREALRQHAAAFEVPQIGTQPVSPPPEETSDEEIVGVVRFGSTRDLRRSITLHRSHFQAHLAIRGQQHGQDLPLEGQQAAEHRAHYFLPKPRPLILSKPSLPISGNGYLECYQ